MSLSNNFPSIRPSLLLDFANTKTLDPRITFSRASTATYYDGKTTVKAEENLLLNSVNLGTPYQILATTLTNNVGTAPDGTTTTSLVVPNSTNTRHYTSSPYSTFTATGTYTISCYVKNGGYNFAHIQLANSAGTGGSRYGITVDLTTGEVGGYSYSSNVSNESVNVVDVGGGWFRCALTATFNTAGIGRIHCYVHAMPSNSATSGGDGLPSYAGNDTDGVYYWGFQLEQRSSVTAYTATTTAPITNYIPALQTATSGTARFDHNPTTGESLGLLIEEQRTNLFTYSEFQSGVGGVGLITESTMFGADGNNVTAAAFGSGGASTTYLYKGTAAASTVYTLSVYVKMDDGGAPVFGSSSSSSSLNDFVVNIGSAIAPPLTYVVTHVGNSLYRVSATTTSSASPSSLVGVIKYANNSARTFKTTGWQLEAGSFATSYIPTVASQVTRSADSASMTGTNFSSWYRADEGTVYTESQVLSTSAANTTVFSISETAIGSLTSSNLITLRNTGTVGTARATLSSSGAAQADISIANTSASKKQAFAFKVNDFVTCVNGSSVTSDTLGSMPFNLNQAGIGSSSAQAIGALNGSIKKIAYYPRRLTNSEIQSLTVI